MAPDYYFVAIHDFRNHKRYAIGTHSQEKAYKLVKAIRRKIFGTEVISGNCRIDTGVYKGPDNYIDKWID